MANNLFNAAGASTQRGLVNKKSADHHEPTSHYNPYLPWYDGFATVTLASLLTIVTLDTLVVQVIRPGQ
jgi:hypothetical protein